MVATGPPIVNSVVLSSFIASPNCEVNTSVLELPVLITLQHDVRCCHTHSLYTMILYYRKYNMAIHSVFF